MGKLRRAYLPRWIAWFTLGCVAVMWLWLTGEAFLSEPGAAELGVLEWLVMTAILAAVVLVVFLMATRWLPAYLIEVPEEEEEGR